MYIDKYNMAKTPMISNEVYNSPKSIKGKKSFSEIIKTLLLKRKKNVNNIAKYYGILKWDKEYDNIKKDIKKMWAKWTKKYN